MQCCLAENIPIVISPIWVSIMRALWGSRGSIGVLNQAVEQGAEATPQMNSLKNRKLAVHVPDGCVQANGESDFDNKYQEIGKWLNKADGLLPNSWLELQAVRTDLNWNGDHFSIAHYGVDSKLFLDANPDKFRSHAKLSGPFILQA